MGGVARRSWADRLLAATGEDEAAVAHSKLRSFRRFLLLVVAAESWHALHYPAYQADAAFHVGLAGALSVCAVLGQLPRLERLATGCASVAMALDLGSVFPENANHQYLGLIAMALMTLPARAHGGTRDEQDEATVQAVLQALRWVVPIGFFWAGVQKLFWGYYFGGEFLAVRVATDSSFALALSPFLSAEEYSRLSALVPGRGSGPYRVSEPLFLLVSNGAWLTELVLAPLLLVRRTRFLAALGVVIFMVAIETGARELFFGMIMISLALLYTKRDANRIPLPVFACALALLLATSAGFLPAWSFG
jgi:hypothetical protein